MSKQGILLRRLLFKWLSFRNYLRVLSKLYFFFFNYGLLKKNRVYEYPYFLDKIIENGDICIDIGANLGYLSVLLSKNAGSKGKVYAVEPVKPVLSVLRENTRNLKNVEILPFALGAENKLVSLGNNSINKKGFIASGSHFILDKHVTQTTNAEVEFDAEMKKGSELFAHLDKLDFIKCDIEGYELVVIFELESIIQKFQPILLIESRGNNRDKILQFFKTLNFSAFVLNNETLYPAKKDEYWDILFVPQSKLQKVYKFIERTIKLQRTITTGNTLK